MSSNTFVWTAWSSLTATKSGKECRKTWNQFKTVMSDRRSFLGKDTHPGWSAARFKDGHRKAESVTEVTALVLDFDHDYTIEQAREAFSSIEGFLHTSKSHTEAEPAFRLVLALSRPVTRNEYAVLWRLVAAACDHHLDPACKDPCRFWYMPGVLSDDAPFVAEEWPGEPLDADAIISACIREDDNPLSLKPKVTQKSNGTSSYLGKGILHAAFEARGWTGKEIDGEKVEAICPWVSSHTPGKGSPSSTVLYPAKPGHEMGHLHCSHAHCSNRTIDDVLALFTQDELDAARLVCGLQPFRPPTPTRPKNGKHYDGPPLWSELDERAAMLEADGIPANDHDGGPKEDYRRQHANERPTTTEPLRGLKYLSKVAVHGRARVIALASEPVNYIWQDIVVAFTICLIAGPPGEGKTSLLFLILAARLNTGEPVHLLGHEIQPAPKGQFGVLIEGEHGESSASRKIVKSVELLGVDDGALDRLILVARRSVKLGSNEWQDVVRMIQAGLVSDIALDTIARVAPANPDSEQEQVQIFETVAAAIDSAPEDLKPTAWAIAHTRKNGSGTLADVSGSAQRTGQADTVLMLKADKSSGNVASVEVTFEKLREPPDEYPHPATFVIGKADDGRTVLTQDKAQTPKDDGRPIEARILDLLAIEPRSKNSLCTNLKRNWVDIDAALTVLFGERRIQTTTVDIRGTARKAYALRDSIASYSESHPTSHQT